MSEKDVKKAIDSLDEELSEEEKTEDKKIALKEEPLLKDQIKAKLEEYARSGLPLSGKSGKDNKKQISRELNCSMRYVYDVHKEFKASLDKIAKEHRSKDAPLQTPSTIADVEEFLSREEPFEIKVEEILRAPPPKPETTTEKAEVSAAIELTPLHTYTLINALDGVISKSLPPALEKKDIRMLAVVWTPVLNKYLQQYWDKHAELMLAAVTTGIIYMPRILGKVKSLKETSESEGGGTGYEQFA